LQNEADQIETLVLTETRQLEEKRKLRSPIQQINNTKHGVAWKVETRASLCRQQEQTTQEVASLEQIMKTRLEISRLEQEAKVLKEKLRSAHPETPLTDKEKQDIIKSLIQSFKNNNNSIDYKLIQDIEKRFPPCRLNEDEKTPTPNDNVCPSFGVCSVPSKSNSPTTTTPVDRPDALPCDKPPSASPNMQRFSEQQLHRYLGFRNIKNWLDLETIGKDTIKVTKGTDRPLELGDVANIPGWQQANHFIQGHASHVSASRLVIPKAPGSLRMAFTTNHPNEATWRESYGKEYKGLIDHNTFNIISEETYLESRERTARSAIPSMGVFTVKNDSDGKPVRTKSRVVALGNKDPIEWTKAECYVPVVSQPIV
jgi:hypothetical protein